MTLHSQSLFEFVLIRVPSWLSHSFCPSLLFRPSCRNPILSAFFLSLGDATSVLVGQICKTNPISETTKPPQPVMPQGFTPIFRSAPPKKTNPIYRGETRNLLYHTDLRQYSAPRRPGKIPGPLAKAIQNQAKRNGKTDPCRRRRPGWDCLSQLDQMRRTRRYPKRHGRRKNRRIRRHSKRRCRRLAGPVKGVRIRRRKGRRGRPARRRDLLSRSPRNNPPRQRRHPGQRPRQDPPDLSICNTRARRGLLQSAGRLKGRPQYPNRNARSADRPPGGRPDENDSDD